MSSVMLKLQLTMFFIMALGWICAKRGIFTKSGREAVTGLFINLMIPASIISAFFESLTPETIVRGLYMVAAYTVCLLLAWLAGKALYRRFPMRQQKILKYATIVSNAQFMGFPVIQAMTGSEGLVLASMAMIPVSVFTWTIALAQFTEINGRQGIRNTLTNPCFCAVVIGVGLVFLPIPLHPGITDALQAVGNCVMPVSMLIIGSILAETDIRSVLDWKLYYFSFIRLIAIPAVLYFLFTAVHLDPLVKNVTVIMAAMPAGTVTAMLAEKYGADARFASSVIFISTLLGIVSLPILAALLL